MTAFGLQSVKTNPFNNDASASRRYGRAERIVAALYLVTNHMPAQEPSRIAVRTSADTLLVSLLDPSAGNSGVNTSMSLVRHLISLLRVMLIAGFVSRSNAEALIEALDDLGVSLSIGGAGMHVVSRDDLVPLADVQRKTYPRNRVSDPLVKDTIDIKDTKDISENVEVMSMDKRNGQKRAEYLRFRSQGILDVLRGSDPMSIKDICARLPEYSEKMIQRELAGLVHEGILRKSGEKRWSRYSVSEMK